MSKITIETTISADPQKVWECWTKPEHITKWNFAVEDWQCPKATNDLLTIFDAENQNPVEMQKEGWQAILNNFKKYVESF